MQAPTRQFRHAVSVLKKQGLLPARTDSGSKLDARSVHPSSKVKGKSLSTLIKKYDDIVSGKVTALKVTPQRLKEFKKAGYETAQGKVLIKHTATERAVLKKGEVSIRSTSGIERVQIPVSYHNLAQYLRDIKKDSKRIGKMKRDKEYFGFRFFGFNSSQLYRDIDDAIEDVSKYQSVIEATGRAKQLSVYKNLEIVKVNRPGDWEFPSDRHRKMSKEYNRKRAKIRRAKLKRMPEHFQEAARNEAAERMRRYRQRLKRNEGRNTKYMKAARKRAHDSYFTRKTKAKKKTPKKGKKK